MSASAASASQSAESQGSSSLCNDPRFYSEGGAAASTPAPASAASAVASATSSTPAPQQSRQSSARAASSAVSSAVASAATPAPASSASSAPAPAASAAEGDCSKQEFLSEVEEAILRSDVPVEIDEAEEITVLGQRGIWANRAEVVNWKGVVPIEEYQINEDSQPEIITKRTEQRLKYLQELAIRYLRPPTPPPPGEILIKQECNSMTPPAPPLIVRQQPARPETPEPLVVREAPPQPPPQVCQKVITISGKRLPPPPRKVVIERLAPLPSKPQSVIIERWLPYSEVKRRVIFQRSCEQDAVACKPKNVIVQWEAPAVDLTKKVTYCGVIRANPAEYVQRYGATLKLAKDLPDFVLDVKTPEGLTLAADYESSGTHELEGDLAAFKLVDLDAEGLAEYRAQLQKLGISYVGAEAAAKLAAENVSLDQLGGSSPSSASGAVSAATNSAASGKASSNAASASAASASAASGSAGSSSSSASSPAAEE